MIRVGIVVQRYGNEVVGGAETLAKNVAERLNSSGFDVTVFTTTSRDYLSWKNEYKQGESVLKGVVIKRFSVARERDIKAFNKYSEIFFSDNPEHRDEKNWIIEQGPYTPDLIEALQDEQVNFDIFLFFTYLYFTTVQGLKDLTKPVILFPTAHDEPPIYLKLMKEVFQRPDALFFLSAAEMNFVKKMFNPKNKMHLIRTGIEIQNPDQEKRFREKFLLFSPYMIYAGRIERGKGLELIFDAYNMIKKQRLINFVLIGKKIMDIPVFEGIRYLGYVSEKDKISAFHYALLSVQPSGLESLSITTLESFSQKTPVLVNRDSVVLDEHVKISGGGLAFSNVDEFIEQFYKIYDKKKFRNQLGLKGYEYLKRYYCWDVVMEKIKEGIISLISSKNS